MASEILNLVDINIFKHQNYGFLQQESSQIPTMNN